MKKFILFAFIFLFAIPVQSFAISKKADMGPVGSCMRSCVLTVNPSSNDVYATDISVDEFTQDCVNYCNPNLKEGYCSPEEDECCNVMVQDTDPDCQPSVVIIDEGELCDLGNDGQQCAAGFTCQICFFGCPIHNSFPAYTCQ
jgi:hypothetical protein